MPAVARGACREDPRSPGLRPKPRLPDVGRHRPAQQGGIWHSPASQPRRLLAVLNPSAGDYAAQRRWPMLEPLLRQAGELALVETYSDRARSLYRLRRALAGRPDRVVVVGGDGTVHQVVNAVMEARGAKRPELAVIPFGTANNLAKSLKLPAVLEEAVRVATGEELAVLDIGRVRLELGGRRRERFWFNCVGVGVDADIVAARARYRRLKGYLAYAAALAERTLVQRSVAFRGRVDGSGVEGRAFDLIVNNLPVYAGGVVLPGARFDDGLLDLYALSRPSTSGASCNSR